MSPRLLPVALVSLGLLVHGAPAAGAQCSGGGEAAPSPAGPAGASSGTKLAGATTGGTLTTPASTPTSSAAARTSRTDGVRGGGRGGSAAAVTAQGQAVVSTSSNWSRWWSRHQDEFVWGRERPVGAARAAVVSGGAARTAGAPPLGDTGQAPLRRSFVHTRVVGPLLEVIRDSHDATLRESAILALGEAVDERFAAVVTDALLPCLADPDARVRSAAALALGLGGDPEAVPALTELARCSAEGHRLVDSSAVSLRVRTAAILGLGYGGDAAALPTLQALADTLPDSAFEMKRATIMALGLMRNDRAPQAAATLVGLLEDRQLDDLIKSAVPPALARLGERSARHALRAALADADTDRVVRQSCVIALGRLGELADPGLLDELLELALEDHDATTRNFATMALARLAAADAAPTRHAALHERLQEVLGEQLEDPEHRIDRPFFALAGGLWLQAHGHDRHPLHARLLDAYDDVNDPAEKGAYALAVGLAGQRESGRLLREDFLDTKDPVFRSHCAVALGLLGYAEADGDLRAAVGEKGQEVYLSRSLGTALMLLDDPRAAAALVEGFEEARSLQHRAGLAQALSAQRHESVVAALRAAVTDERLDELSRASACAALGWVAGRERLPWRAQLSVDSNFATATPTVDDVLGMP